MLKIISFLLNLVVFFAVLWIIIPAPAYNIWLFSVAASEWSLWLGAAALIAIVISICTGIYSSSGKLWIFSLLLSISAFVISLYPLYSVLSLAEDQNVSLSFGEYFSGLKGENDSAAEFTTHTFANHDGKDLQFDVYAPRLKNENNGASIIVIHGGSWNAGNRNDFPQWNRWLAAEGFTVFDIDYRIAPQPNYQSATGDVKCAVRYIKSHGAEFGIAPDRIALFGRSAGGQLALLAAFSADDSRLPPSCPENEQSERVRAVVSFYAPIDMLWAYDNPANQFVIKPES